MDDAITYPLHHSHAQTHKDRGDFWKLVVPNQVAGAAKREIGSMLLDHASKMALTVLESVT